MKLRRKLEMKQAKVEGHLKELDAVKPCTHEEELRMRRKLASKFKEKLLQEQAEDRILLGPLAPSTAFGKWDDEEDAIYSGHEHRGKSSSCVRSAVVPVQTPSTSRGFYASSRGSHNTNNNAAHSYRADYTGYETRRSRSRSPLRQSHFKGAAAQKPDRQPSPPRNMPEHIRWLHERWRKYDGRFFDEKKAPEPPKILKAPSNDERASYRRDMDAYRQERQHAPSTARKFHEQPPPPSQRMQPRSRRDDLKNIFSQPYYQFRKGGEYYSNPGRILSFKEFLLSQEKEVKDQDEAVLMYNNYKLEFRKRAFAEFFQAHCEEEWFLEKYHPLLKSKKEQRRRDQIHKRLTVFMQLLVRGWIEVSIDVKDSRLIRRLLDAAIVLLEGGDEGDLSCLSELDYVLEEKKEESYVINPQTNNDSDSDEDNETNNDISGKAPGGGRSKEEQEEIIEEGEKPTNEQLEAMQLAKDYTYYVKEKMHEPANMCEAPEMLEDKEVVRSHEYKGSGVFVSQVMNPKVLDEMNLHKCTTLLIRNVPPTVPRKELEDLVSDSHGGFLRLHLTQPEPSANYFRQAIASFWHNANTQKILWKIRGYNLRGSNLVVIEYRDFHRRIYTTDGIAGDKSVVLRDIQLCKSLIEYLDRKYYLWDQTPQDNQPQTSTAADERGDPPKVNPLLINLDDCLAFHLQQLIDSGEDPEKLDSAIAEGALAKIDREDNLNKLLDRLVLYLRIVHSVDYYGCVLHDSEDDEPRRIGPIHVRGEAIKSATPKRLAKYIRKFENKLKDLLPQDKRLAKEHIEILGKKEAEPEVDRFIESSILSVRDGMSKCTQCSKRFTSQEFAQMHVKDKHADKLEEVKWVVVCFNNYLADPNRPCAVDLSTQSNVQTTNVPNTNI